MPDNSIYSERELIQRISEGDEKAFREIFDKYQRKVYYISWRTLQSVPEAEDAVQEIFGKLWQTRAKLPEIIEFNAYLNTVIRNHLANVIRKMANKEVFLLEISRQSSEEINSSLSITQLNEFKQILSSILTSLPPRQQEVFRLSKIEGWKLDEIAVTMKISKETVKKHLGLAIDALRKALLKNIFILLPLFLG